MRGAAPAVVLVLLGCVPMTLTRRGLDLVAIRFGGVPLVVVISNSLTSSRA
jgi:hypothetical protein